MKESECKNASVYLEDALKKTTELKSQVCTVIVAIKIFGIKDMDEEGILLKLEA